jgi:hypothetical protein
MYLFLSSRTWPFTVTETSGIWAFPSKVAFSFVSYPEITSPVVSGQSSWIQIGMYGVSCEVRSEFIYVMQKMIMTKDTKDKPDLSSERADLSGTAMARTSSNSKLQTRPLVREGAIK